MFSVTWSSNIWQCGHLEVQKFFKVREQLWYWSKGWWTVTLAKWRTSNNAEATAPIYKHIHRSFSSVIVRLFFCTWDTSKSKQVKINLSDFVDITVFLCWMNCCTLWLQDSSKIISSSQSKNKIAMHLCCLMKQIIFTSLKRHVKKKNK